MFGFLKQKRPAGRTKTAAARARSVDVLGRALPLTIRENRRATRITLRIEPGGKALKMTVPPGLRHHDIDAFLERHEGWLRERISRMEQRATAFLKDGGSVPLRGVDHRIEHTGRMRGLTESIVIDGEAVLRVSGLPEHLPRRIADFLKREARRDLEARVAVHAASVGRPVRSMTLKDTRSRWGSCSHAGALSFSWRIVMAPPDVIDYLAAHECAHLKEMNHGPGFWALCERLCPGTDRAKAWLKEHGNALHAVDFG
ncbi:M48 family metallopeptidase [Rhizobiaceae bacterium BDR2-2]|uniref:M48 family metallopeptidase n=1 Tax=Ectorhizobium quercum TaxID=2965071 RepID=A0AAE3N584_9HYPH|nr:SprT family zinc-dependent metalloprotease [Ectorhizobium quercum]MCX8999480.1 M48 family metallopeptidase [Ectorhizobium quercum]